MNDGSQEIRLNLIARQLILRFAMLQLRHADDDGFHDDDDEDDHDDDDDDRLNQASCDVVSVSLFSTQHEKEFQVFYDENVIGSFRF